MSVAECLGLIGDPDGRLAEATRRWPDWAREQPVLSVLDELRLGDLRAWLYESQWQRSDAVLRALVTISTQNRDDAAAAATLVAWALLPGAIVVANSIRRMSRCGDELVAGQLWLEIRTFEVARGAKVAAGILRNTRSRVLLDLGARSQMERSDRAWSRTVLTGLPSALPEPRDAVAAAVDPGEELHRLLVRGCAQGAVGVDDVGLLMSLLGAVEHQTPRYALSGGGLLTDCISQRVAAQTGTSPATVRRHARRSMRALAEVARRTA